MNIRWDQLGKQLTDWGGDYDIFGDVSVKGGARDPVANALPIGTQGQTKPGYDKTGRKVPQAASRAASPIDVQGISATQSPALAAQAAQSAKLAQENARKASLRGEANTTLDELLSLYDNVINAIRKVGSDTTSRLNKEYDQKVQGQVEDMNSGMYDVDAAAAANNLADSSFRSFDRGKVRKAADANIETLNRGRQGDIAKVGADVEGDVAKYSADKAGIGRTRNLLGQSDDLNEIQSTANNLDATRRGVRADMAKYGTQGEFTRKANALGNYDTSALEATLRSVVDNASAAPATKAGTINDILEGSAADEAEKQRLRNKYTQVFNT